MNIWCSDFPTEIIGNVITPNGSDVWYRVSMTDYCCETAEKVSAEFPPLASCLMIEETITAELRLKAGRVKCLKISSSDSCVMTEEMLIAGFELRTGTVNGCEIPSFSDWIMPWTMDTAEMRSEADKVNGSELIKNMKRTTGVSTSHLTCLQACSPSLISLIVSRWAVVTSLKWIDDRPCSIASIITH